LSILVELRSVIADAFREGRPFPNQIGKWILWLDADREWERLLDRIGDDWELVRYQGSQLEIRVILECEKGRRPRLIYVPLRRDELTVLKEYEFLGPVFERPLLKALREWGVEIDSQEEKAIKPILPILADRWAERPLSFWRELSRTRVLERLFDEEQVSRLIREPRRTVEDLKRDGLLEVFEDFLKERFGMALALAKDPEDASQRFVEALLLVEARTAGAGRTGFPYPDRLPQDHGHEACVKFLRNLLHARNGVDLIIQRLLKAEERVQLGPWAATLPGYLETEGSLSVEEALLERTTAELRDQGEQKRREEYLRINGRVFGSRASHFWSWAGGPSESIGRIPEWKALAVAAEFVDAARTTLENNSAIEGLGAITKEYASDGYRVDSLYRQYRARFETLPRLEEVRTTVRKLHRSWQEETNKRFTSLLDAAGGTSAVSLTRQTDFWDEEVLCKKHTAVLILDAFRFELGRALEEIVNHWGGPISCEVEAMLGLLPSITPIGMAGVVAGQPIDGRIENGKWTVGIRGDTSSPLNLAVLDDRRQLIKKRDPNAVFLDLRELLDLAASKIPKGKLVVVFSKELDTAGHSGVLSLTPTASEDYARRASDAVRKLGNAGYEHVHIVTDHGFFLLDEVREEDVITVEAEGVQYKSHRALIAERIGTKTLLHLPFDQTGLRLAVPHGVGILQARGPYEYFHGGASLQELIIPHVRVHFPAKLQAFDLRVEMTSRITSRLFDVRLVAIDPSPQKELLGSKYRPRYTELKLFRVVEGENIGDPLAKASGTEIFVGEQQKEKFVRMRIAEGAFFSYGDRVRLVACDADAPGTVLHRCDATLHIDPEP